MGNVTLSVSAITSLLTDTNLWVIYLSLVVLFFLIGLVLGLNIGTRKSLPKDVKVPESNDIPNKSRQPLISGQENRENQQIYNTNQGHHSRRRHHKHTSMHIQ